MLSLCRIPCPPDYLQQRWKEGRKRLIHVFCSQVSATFAASLVTSPAIGAYLSQAYGDTLVVVLASGVALLDIGFILLAVPESLPEEMRPVSWGAPISWEQADPFAVSHPAAVLPRAGNACVCSRYKCAPTEGAFRKRNPLAGMVFRLHISRALGQLLNHFL